jgi:hypothetical protein
MKKLILSAVVAFASFTSTAQVFTLQTFDFQEIIIRNDDTTFSEVMPFTATYIFDITGNTITADINGVVTTLSVFCFVDSVSEGDQYAGLSYNDFPTRGWLINITTKEVVYVELRDGYDYACRFKNAVLTKL